MILLHYCNTIMNNYLKSLLLILIIIGSALKIFSQTHVSGVVNGIWNQEGSPYILDSTIVILQNTFLRIDSGVTVLLGAQDSIKVNGTFKAFGTESDSVYFLPAEGDSTWKLIYFYPESDDNNRFRYCHFEECGGYLIKNSDCSQEYSHCTFVSQEYSLVFDNNDGSITDCVFITGTWGLHMKWGSNMLIEGNNFSGSGAGIDGYSASGIITNNVMNNNNTFLLLSSMSGMTISNNIIGGGIIFSGFNTVISDNTIDGDVSITGSGITLSGNTINDQVRFDASESTMIGNVLTFSGMSWGLDLDQVNDVLIQNNQISNEIHTFECDELTIRDNQLQGIISMEDEDLYVINNNFSNSLISVCDEGHVQIDSNYIEGKISASDESLIEARHNAILWLSGEYKDELVTVAGTMIFENNTIVCESYSTFVTELIYVMETGDLTLTNNIIVGDNINSVGLKVVSGGVVDHSYNLFWKCDTIYAGCLPGVGEFYADPMLIEGDPFDPALLAVSPCIDAGALSFPNDPDGTRIDIGCLFFDTRYDHPPGIYSDTSSIASLGEEYSYWAKACDDGYSLNFSFENLPAWLNAPALFTLADSVELSGLTPEYQDDFEFFIRVEDSGGQIDSQWVAVETVPYNLLYGTIYGVLPAENSPYLMTADVIVPGWECLIIEPGVEIYVRKHYEPDGLFTIKVYGQLIAEGSAEDSIIFVSAEEEPDKEWGGIKLINSRQDSSIISFCHIEDASYGAVFAYYSNKFRTNNNLFKNNYAGIRMEDNSSGIVSYNTFYESYPFYIYICQSSAEIYENTFFDSLSSAYVLIWDYSSGQNYNNRFMGINGLVIDHYSDPIVCWNIFNLYSGFGDAININNGSEPVIFNNNISAAGEGIDIGSDSYPVINNNIISNCTGYGIGVTTVGTYPDTFYIQYNNLWNNSGGNYVNCPAYFGNMISLNANGDSCDIYFNISQDPMFEGGEPFSFILQDDSPCIDAGNPDSEYFDIEDPNNPSFALFPAKGTIINDMGLYGGHETSLWTGIDNREESNLPKTAALYQNYPNPFNSVTRIDFSLPVKSKAKLTIYNILGEEVICLCDCQLDEGAYSYNWDASNAASGVYFINLNTELFQKSKIMVLLK